MSASKLLLTIMYIAVSALAVFVGLLVFFDPFGSYWLADSSVRVPILMYHHFADDGNPSTTISAEVFEGHLRALRDAGYTAVSFGELVDYVDNGTALPERPVVITIDDGYRSVYDVAFPLLREYDMHAISFIVGVSHGSDVYKDTARPILPRFGDAEAVEMVESGVISIQSHSFDMHHHEPFETGDFRQGVLMRGDETEQEYVSAFTEDFHLAAGQIEAMLGERVFVYSYPYGIHTGLTERLLRDFGIRATLTIEPGMNIVVAGSPETLFAMRRFNVPGGMGAEALLRMIGG